MLSAKLIPKTLVCYVPTVDFIATHKLASNKPDLTAKGKIYSSMQFLDHFTVATVEFKKKKKIQLSRLPQLYALSHKDVLISTYSYKALGHVYFADS